MSRLFRRAVGWLESLDMIAYWGLGLLIVLGVFVGGVVGLVSRFGVWGALASAVALSGMGYQVYRDVKKQKLSVVSSLLLIAWFLATMWVLTDEWMGGPPNQQ